jgi:hypothetical protein
VALNLGARRLLLLLGAAGVAGIGVFGVMLWQATTVERRDGADAARAFDRARAGLGRTQPIVETGADGVVRRVLDPPGDPGGRVTTLRVLAFRASAERLVAVEIPFWFVRLKGPAIRIPLRDTGFDLDRLGISPAELQRYGPGLVLDERRLSGDRVLVWTE